MATPSTHRQEDPEFRRRRSAHAVAIREGTPNLIRKLGERELTAEQVAALREIVEHAEPVATR